MCLLHFYGMICFSILVNPIFSALPSIIICKKMYENTGYFFHIIPACPCGKLLAFGYDNPFQNPMGSGVFERHFHAERTHTNLCGSRFRHTVADPDDSSACSCFGKDRRMILTLPDHKADIFDQPSASVLLSGWIQKTDAKRRMPFRKQSS